MVYKFVAIVLVLCSSAELYCSANDWVNFIDACVFRDMFNTHDYGLNAYISNANISVYETVHNNLGLFTCFVLKNKDLQYQNLEIELSDEAYKRKIESNACRRYPLRNDLTEFFNISGKQEVRVVTYRPVGSPFEMQSIKSIKLNNVEQLYIPSQNQMVDAQSIIVACERHAASRRYAQFADCQYENLFKIFKIKINDKLVWCYIQTVPTTKQIDFDISNNNYNLIETSPRLDIIRNIKNNYVIVNSKNSRIREYPRILAVQQHDTNEKSPSISFIRINSKPICQTPLVEKTINCGRPTLEVQPFGSNVYPAQYPWIVLVYRTNAANANLFELVCEGTLIDHETIITGAGCVMDDVGKTISSENLHIVTNKTDNTQLVQANELLAVRSVIISEHYNKQYFEFDVALLKLEKPLTNFLNVTIPICTTNNPELFVDKPGIVTGFGLDRMSNRLTQLSQARVAKLRSDVCRKRDGYFRMYLNENTFCAEYTNDTIICPEMFGSGMFVKVNDVWLLSGVVTIGVATSNRCSLTAISLYSDISSLHGFIEANRS